MLNNLNTFTQYNKSITFKKGNINFDQIENLNIRNYRKLSDKTISGGTFSYRDQYDLVKLKDAGIDNIIDFRAEAQNTFGKVCEDKGFKYLNFPLDTIMHRDKSVYFKEKSDGKKVATSVLVEKLNSFIKMIQNGNTYMGCHYGIDRTNIGAILYYLFTKDETAEAPKILNWSDQSKKSVLNKDFKIVKRILKSLSLEQKRNLNLNENISEVLIKKYKFILQKNRAI